MEKINEVLIVLNSFKDAKIILKKGFFLANKFNAKVSLLYVHETPLFSIEALFKSDSKIDKTKIQEHAKELLKEFSDEEIAVVVKIDDTANRIWDIVRDDLDTLILSQYHKKISKKIVEKLKQPLFFIKSEILDYKNAIAVIESLNFGKDTINECKDFGIEAFELIYNFYYIPDSAGLDPALEVGIDTNIELLQTEEELFDKFKKENAVRGEFFVNSLLGEEDLSSYINKENIDLLCYKEQGADMLFANGPIEDLLENINCDILLEKSNAI